MFAAHEPLRQRNTETQFRNTSVPLHDDDGHQPTPQLPRRQHLRDADEDPATLAAGRRTPDAETPEGAEEGAGKPAADVEDSVRDHPRLLHVDAETLAELQGQGEQRIRGEDKQGEGDHQPGAEAEPDQGTVQHQGDPGAGLLQPDPEAPAQHRHQDQREQPPDPETPQQEPDELRGHRKASKSKFELQRNDEVDQATLETNPCLTRLDPIL